MIPPKSISDLRAANWSDIPASSGIYFWYFPQESLDDLQISRLASVKSLRLRITAGGKICLYCGMANNLRQRIKWHAAQKLTTGALKSGFLSTFRLTLLALNDVIYSQGDADINSIFDMLSISWVITGTRKEAEEIENHEIAGDYHYPLNIQKVNKTELQGFTTYLKSARKEYRNLYDSRKKD